MKKSYGTEAYAAVMKERKKLRMTIIQKPRNAPPPPFFNDSLTNRTSDFLSLSLLLAPLCLHKFTSVRHVAVCT